MNIGEATSWQIVASFLVGDLDHCDEVTRHDIATALTDLDQRARKPLMAGTTHTVEQWDELLCNVTFEGT
jgi:hypothetical protein